jgi:hypothetical protein
MLKLYFNIFFNFTGWIFWTRSVHAWSAYCLSERRISSTLKPCRHAECCSKNIPRTKNVPTVGAVWMMCYVLGRLPVIRHTLWNARNRRMIRSTRKIENWWRTESQAMFLYRVSERLCACAEGYFCLKVEPLLRSYGTSVSFWRLTTFLLTPGYITTSVNRSFFQEVFHSCFIYRYF